jgi:hypothetical protein
LLPFCCQSAAICCLPAAISGPDATHPLPHSYQDVAKSCQMLPFPAATTEEQAFEYKDEKPEIRS